MSGLNPPLTDISESGTTLSRITSINCTSDILLDSYPTFSDDFDTTMSSSTIDDDKLSSVCNSNPFLSQTHNIISNKNKDLVLGSLENDNVKVKVEEISSSSNINKQSSDVTLEAMTSSTKITTTTAATQQQQQQQQQQVNSAADGKPQQKLLLFMNTPENRAKLAGTNFNIINANLLSKISSGSQQDSKQTMNLINLKKCIRLNNSLKKDESALGGEQENKVTASSVNATLQSIMAATQQKEKRILPIDVLNGHTYGISRKERDSQEIDSGEGMLYSLWSHFMRSRKQLTSKDIGF